MTKRLKEERAKALEAAKKLVSDAEAEKRELKPEESKQILELSNKAKDLEKQIAQAQELEQAVAYVSVEEQSLDQVEAPKTVAANRTYTNGKPSRIEVSDKPEIMKDAKRGFSDVGDYVSAIMRLGAPRSDVDRRFELWAAAGTGNNQSILSEGGALVPPQFNTMIWDGVRNASDSLLQYCDQYTLETGDSLTFNAADETSRANGSRWGGVRGYWIAELAQPTSSYPKFRQVKLEPKQLAVFCYASDKLLKNASTALTQWLTKAATDEISFKVGDAIVNGTGAGQPQGVMNAACKIDITKETDQAATTIVKANIDKMYARLNGRMRAGAKWLINQDCLPQLEALSADVGTGGVPVYLPAGGYTEAPNARLKGLPVLESEYCQTLGTSGDILLVNLQGMAVVTRGSIDSAVSMHLKFDYLQSAFRWVWELDAQPWLASAITPYKGSNTTSPFISLATRS